jgi:hypothetical protein
MTQLLEALNTFLEAVSVAAKWRQLDPVVARTEKRIGSIFKRQGQIFLRGFAGLRGQIGEAAFREALGADDWIRVFDLATGATTEAFFEIIQGAARDALRRGASQTLADVNIDIAFNLRNPRAESYLQQHGYGLISQIDAVTRGNIATIIDNGTREGWSYNRMAREINTLYREMAVGRPQQHIDSRGHLIAVTEIGQAYEAGSSIVVADLQEAGLQMEKMWLTVGDGRVSPGCQANMSEGWIPNSQSHASGHMNPLRFPGCRCTELYRRKPSTPGTSISVPGIGGPTLPAAPGAPGAPRPVRAPRPGDGDGEDDDDGPVVVDAPGAIPEFTIPAQPRGLQYVASEEDRRIAEEAVDSAIRMHVARRGGDPDEIARIADETFRKLVLENNIAIQFRSEHIDSLLTDGRFKTQFETGVSGGTLNTRIRAEAEQFGLGIPEDIDPTQRPLYGFIDLGQMSRFNVQQYGDLTFIAKPEVRQRSTVTADDSLENMQNSLVAGTPASDPGKAGWDRQVSPLYQYAQSGDLTDITYSFSYIEVQMQGGVTLDDMQAVVDKKGVLTAEQRQALEARGVEVWDK